MFEEQLNRICVLFAVFCVVFVVCVIVLSDAAWRLTICVVFFIRLN
jgi:hypothetical protein